MAHAARLELVRVRGLATGSVVRAGLCKDLHTILAAAHGLITSPLSADVGLSAQMTGADAFRASTCNSRRSYVGFDPSL